MAPPALPTHMRALIQTTYGPPSKSLTVQTIPLPTFNPTSDDLLIRVHCASIAPSEWGFLNGNARIFGVFTIPTGLGIDLSGVVVRAGDTAKALGWKEGDEVMGAIPISRKGVYQEYARAPAKYFARKPTTLSWEEASCLGGNGLTAYEALMKHKGARDVAFVTGGLGGVGLLAVQLLHGHFGFKRIITSVSTGKVERIKELYPYLEVIDYNTTNPTKVIPPGTVDLVFSTIGSPGQFAPLLSLAHPDPSLIEILTASPTSVVEPCWEVTFPWYARWLFNSLAWFLRPRVPEGVRFVPHVLKPSGEDLAVLGKEAEEGRLRPLVGQVFTLEQGAEAYELAHKGVVGKVVFKMVD